MKGNLEDVTWNCTFFFFFLLSLIFIIVFLLFSELSNAAIPFVQVTVLFFCYVLLAVSGREKSF